MLSPLTTSDEYKICITHLLSSIYVFYHISILLYYVQQASLHNICLSDIQKIIQSSDLMI